MLNRVQQLRVKNIMNYLQTEFFLFHNLHLNLLTDINLQIWQP